jgi:hypothetical protein
MSPTCVGEQKGSSSSSSDAVSDEQHHVALLQVALHNVTNLCATAEQQPQRQRISW